MIKKVGVVDKPEAIIKLSEQAVQDHHQGMKNVLNYRCASKETFIDK